MVSYIFRLILQVTLLVDIFLKTGVNLIIYVNSLKTIMTRFIYSIIDEIERQCIVREAVKALASNLIVRHLFVLALILY